MLLLQNAQDVYGKKIEILIHEDKIEEIAPYIKPSSKMKTLDLKGKLVMPGIIDLHTHMREPGFTHKEDFESGSKACAKGGITTFYDMPNTNPMTVTLEALVAKKTLAKEKSLVNFGFHFGASKHDNVDEIKKVLQTKEANSVKLFLNVSTGEMLIEEERVLKSIFKNSSLVLVHAENEMVDKAIELNDSNGNGVYICHIPSQEELEKAIRAKQEKKTNKPIYAELTPHHLFLNEEIKNSSEKNKMLLRMKPELRTKTDNDFLWNAINKGFIDTIATDHAPHLVSEKEEKVTFGVPGVETSLALMLDASSKGKIPLPMVQKLMCKNPAQIMKIKGRGTLKKGFYADIIIIDMDKQWELTSKELESKCGWSPFEGYKLQGKVHTTIVNGHIVYENENLHTNTIFGREVEFYE